MKVRKILKIYETIPLKAKLHVASQSPDWLRNSSKRPSVNERDRVRLSSDDLVELRLLEFNQITRSRKPVYQWDYLWNCCVGWSNSSKVFRPPEYGLILYFHCVMRKQDKWMSTTQRWQWRSKYFIVSIAPQSSFGNCKTKCYKSKWESITGIDLRWWNPWADIIYWYIFILCSFLCNEMKILKVLFAG